MSTSALICYVYEDGWFECNTIQYDGYPENVLPKLNKGFNTEKTASDLVEGQEIRELGESLRDTEYFDDDSISIKLRNGNNEKFSARTIRHIASLLYCDYIYWWDESEQRWNSADSSSSSLFLHEKRNNRKTTRKFESNSTEAKRVVNEEFSPNSLEDCRQRIKRLLNFAGATTYSAIGHEDSLVLDSGEFLESVHLFEDGNCKYLQYEPSSGKVVTNYRNLSYREVAEILENIENDYI